MLTLQKIQAAALQIQPFVHKTPIHTSKTLDEMSGCSLFFKCENFQKTGSFKYRGATNAVLQLDKVQAKRGVVTHSSGNHAQALALAAKVHGIPAYIVMPHTAPAVKKQAVIGYGGQVIECEPTLAAREKSANEIVQATGGTLIPPFDHYDVIAGQGTIALELFAQLHSLDAIVVPVGGGGMISGISYASKSLHPNIRIFGAEPSNVNDAYQSKRLGSRQPQIMQPTIADGLTTSLGEYTWPIVRDYVDEILTVSEEEIRSAQLLIWERMKLVIEPSAGVGVAVVLKPEYRHCFAGKNVAVVLCGGNTAIKF